MIHINASFTDSVSNTFALFLCLNVRTFLSVVTAFAAKPVLHRKPLKLEQIFDSSQ
jgi:hypothetical protein